MVTRFFPLVSFEPKIPILASFEKLSSSVLFVWRKIDFLQIMKNKTVEGDYIYVIVISPSNATENYGRDIRANTRDEEE